MCAHLRWCEPAKGILYSGCPCVHDHVLDVCIVIPYKLFVQFSPIYIFVTELRGHRWTHYILRSKGQRCGSWQEKMWSKAHRNLQVMCSHVVVTDSLSSKGTPLSIVCHAGPTAWVKKRISVHFTVVSTYVDWFVQYLAQRILRKYATQKLLICPPHLHN